MSQRKLVRVACAVFLRDGRLFACRRPLHKALGGLWEFPGGKLEAGESGEQALLREVREELAVEASIVRALTPVRHAYPDFDIELLPYVARLEVGEPVLHEHIDAGWFSKEDFRALDWAPADLPILDELAALEHW